MQSANSKGFYSIRADANALGGLLEKPLRKTIPTLAPVSVPAVGGFAMARSEAFTLDNIVSCSSAYTRVSGQEDDDGSISILVTAVVEGLNLLEVVEAERVVAQLSITIPGQKRPLRVSTAGSRFEGLRLAGHPRFPRLNEELQRLEGIQASHAEGLTESNVQSIGQGQANAIIEGFKGRPDDSAAAWAKKRFEWMTQPKSPRGGNLCSLVDGFEQPAPNSCGHVVEIPGFGRIILGELLLAPDSVQLVSIRAELGCPVKGKITINCVGGGGVHD